MNTRSARSKAVLAHLRGPIVLIGALLIALPAALAGCSSAATPAASPVASPTASPVASPTIAIAGAWVRVSTGMDKPTAGYLTITNSSATGDALLSASSPGASSVELHETALDSAGMMGMHPIDRLDVPANGSVTLAPGGYHLMIMGLKAPLKAGDRFELQLVFDHAGPIVVQAEVRQG